MKDLSVIVVSYNTKDLILQTLSSVRSSLTNVTGISYEVIVVDNGSTDGSIQELKKLNGHEIKLIENGMNTGFGAANNRAAMKASGKYLLFLNSDTIVKNVNFKKLLAIMDERQDIGVLTVKLNLPDGSVDPASHRGFPTLWRSFTYFSKLERLTTSVPLLNRLFGGYHLTYMDLNTEHEIDCPSGAFFLTRKELFDKVGGFDEAFFMYAEDIDLAWRIKEAGYRIWYYPYMSIVHIKGQSGRKAGDMKKKSVTNKHFYKAMKIFYKKHYEQQYPRLANSLVYLVLNSKL